MQQVETKTCTVCFKIKALSEFHSAGKGRTLSGRLHLRGNCKRCHNFKESRRHRDKKRKAATT